MTCCQSVFSNRRNRWRGFKPRRHINDVKPLEYDFMPLILRGCFLTDFHRRLGKWDVFLKNIEWTRVDSAENH
jgi:hypothetical protein